MNEQPFYSSFPVTRGTKRRDSHSRRENSIIKSLIRQSQIPDKMEPQECSHGFFYVQGLHGSKIAIKRYQIRYPGYQEMGVILFYTVGKSKRIIYLIEIIFHDIKFLQSFQGRLLKLKENGVIYETWISLDNVLDSPFCDGDSGYCRSTKG